MSNKEENRLTLITCLSMRDQRSAGIVGAMLSRLVWHLAGRPEKLDIGELLDQVEFEDGVGVGWTVNPETLVLELHPFTPNHPAGPVTTELVPQRKSQH